MVYRSVGNTIAVSLKNLRLPIPDFQTKMILAEMGFSAATADITSIARGLVGRSKYQRGAKPHQAPSIVDCSSMVKWIYGRLGIWLPRYSIDQRDCGIEVTEPIEGDLVFSSGWRSYYWNDPKDNVGHVGIVTKAGTVIHAANKRLGVIESKWGDFISQAERFRGIRRYMTEGGDFCVLQMNGRNVETSQELRWLILQRL